MEKIKYSIRILRFLLIVFFLGIFSGGSTQAVGYSYPYSGRTSLLSQLIGLFSLSANTENNSLPSRPTNSLLFHKADLRVSSMSLLLKKPKPKPASKPLPKDSNCEYGVNKDNCEARKCSWAENGKNCVGPNDLGCQKITDKNICNTTKCSWKEESQCLVINSNICNNRPEEYCASKNCKWEAPLLKCISTCFSITTVTECKARNDCASISSNSCKGA